MKTYQSLMLLAALGALHGCAAVGSSKFACPNPQGVTCMSATDVYQATNTLDEIKGVDAKTARKLAREGKAAGKTVGSVPAPDRGNTAPAMYVAPRGATAAPGAHGTPAIASDRCCGKPATALRLDGDTLGIAIPGTATVTNYRDYEAQVAVTNKPATRAPVPALGADSSPDAFRQSAKIMRIYIRPWEDDAGDLHMSGFIFTEIEARKWSVAQRATEDDGLFRLLEAPGKEAAQDAPVAVGKATPTAPRSGSQAAGDNP